jgi:uncharacterized phiE125 gp8 family phage protein
MKLRQLTPVDEVVVPINIEDIRAHLRIEHNDMDSYLNELISDSLDIAEQYIDGIIADREFEYFLDQFSSLIELPLRPIDLDSIVVSYTDDNGDPQTVSSFDTSSTAYTTTIAPDYGETWPSVETKKDNVRITFKAGYKAAEGKVPGNINRALYMIVGTLDDQRNDHSAGVELKAVPTSSNYLLDPHRKVTV